MNLIVLDTTNDQNDKKSVNSATNFNHFYCFFFLKKLLFEFPILELLCFILFANIPDVHYFIFSAYIMKNSCIMLQLPTYA